MAKARQIIKRRKVVSNTRKITRTMQLIATARFQQAMSRALATRPYTRKITELVEQLSGSVGAVSHELMRDNPDAARDALIVITANRGFCGGYNAGVLRTALAFADGPRPRPIELHVIGKKGVNYFRFLGREMAQRLTHIGDRPRFDHVEAIAVQMMDAYRAGSFGAVHVAYMRFHSVGRQSPEVVQLLPLRQAAPPAAEKGAAEPAPAATKTVALYEFSPPPAELLARLLPQTVKVRLFQCFTDAAVSEQVSRMVAMKAATEAAGEMIKLLTRRYNRARQTQITMELLDIVGGAEVLK